MPFLNYKFLMLRGKFLCFRKLPDFQPLRLPQAHLRLQVKDRLASTMPHVDVYRFVLIAVEKELVAVLLKNLRHIFTVSVMHPNSDSFVKNKESSSAGRKRRQLQREDEATDKEISWLLRKTETCKRNYCTRRRKKNLLSEAVSV